MRVFIEVLLFTGVAIIVASSLAAVWMRGVLVRLHYISPITSLGAPLIGLALALEDGWSTATASTLITVTALALSGPVVEVATARVVAQREAIISQESPQ